MAGGPDIGGSPVAWAFRDGGRRRHRGARARHRCDTPHQLDLPSEGTANDAALMMTASLELLEELTALVSAAARAIQKAQASLGAPQLKADRSPVTAADLAAQGVILDGLARLLPSVPVVS